MESTINITSESLANYIMFKLDKIDNNFTQSELNQITEVVIDYKNDEGIILLSELSNLQKLKSITIRNGYIENEDYNIFLNLKELSELNFEKCEFEKIELISSLNLNSLSLIACKINDYSFLKLLKNLENLTIIGGSIKNEILNTLEKLTFLRLSYTDIIGNDKLTILNIKTLYIDNTNIINLEFIKRLSNLEKIIIDNNQYDNNKQIINDLIKNNILVLDENMVEFGVKDE